MFFKILGRLFRLIMVFGIIEHGSTHTDLPFLAHEDLVVDTAFTAGPEILVLGEFGVGDGLIAQFGVDLHDGQPGGETEDLGIGVGLAAQFEDLFLDHLGQTALPEGRRDDEPRIGHIFPMAPGLDIAKAGPDALFRKSDDGLPFAHLLLDIVRAAFGNAGTPRLGGRFHFIANDPGKILMGLVGNKYLKMLLLFHVLNGEFLQRKNQKEKLQDWKIASLRHETSSV